MMSENFFKNNIEPLLLKSLKCAAIEQKLQNVNTQLKEIIPDILDQYTAFKVDNEYLNVKVRNMHSFQISLIKFIIKEFSNATIVDIGDSSGTHLEYIKHLFSVGRELECIGVNLDESAVERIKKKGLHAICSRAENLSLHGINPDIFLCFETLEHLFDPCKFLYKLSTNTDAKYFILTVPYVRKSRVGLYQIRKGNVKDFGAETTHIFELSPMDWKLIFKFSGWKVVNERIYYQYPRKHWLRFTELFWKKLDFEGFYGVILKPDSTWSSRYKDW